MFSGLDPPEWVEEILHLQDKNLVQHPYLVREKHPSKDKKNTSLQTCKALFPDTWD
jgi:hypothetical protein